MCFWFSLKFIFFPVVIHFWLGLLLFFVFGCHQNTHSNGGSIIISVSSRTVYVSSAGFWILGWKQKKTNKHSESKCEAIEEE